MAETNRRQYQLLVLMLLVFGMMPLTPAQNSIVQEPDKNLTLIPRPAVETPEQKIIEVKNDQVLTIANESIVNVQDNILTIEKTAQSVLISPTEDFISIEDTLLDVKQIIEPKISILVETPTLSKQVWVEKEAQKLNIEVENVTASTAEVLEVKDAKLYIVSEQKNLEIKVLPVIASESVKKAEPQLVRGMELKVENEKPAYEIKGVQSVEVADGVVSVEIVSMVDGETGSITATQKLIKKNNQAVSEEGSELLVVEDNKLVKLSGISDKELKREKLLAESVKPLVALEKVRSPVLLKKEKFVLQTEMDCAIPGKELLVRTDNYDFVAIETDNIEELIKKECVLKVCDEGKVREFVNYSKKVLKVEADEKIRKLELKKSIHDVVEIPQLKVYMEEDEWEVKEGQTSPYQQFVTPDKVETETAGLTKEEIYGKVRSFVWVSDSVLHNIPEKWLLPVNFLYDTPAMETNPVKGNSASDCSEQANTLVSMLRASGVPAENVRVALGKVDFGGNIGGHAWVEIKEDGRWTVLEATSGPFYDEEEGKKIERAGVLYDYWKYHEYPVVEVWAYYNDKYFTDKNEEVAGGWSQGAETAIEDGILQSFAGGEFDISKIIADFVSWIKSLFWL